MIVDTEKYHSTSRGSSQKILCRCDRCGADKLVKKHDIGGMAGATYTFCYICRSKVNAEKRCVQRQISTITGAMNMDAESFERLTVPQPWSEDQIKRLFHLRNVLGWDWSDIAGDLGRTESGVKSKFKYVAYERETKAPSVPFVREPVPENVLVDRAKRIVAWGERSLTAAICGDPPVQFSALARAGK